MITKFEIFLNEWYTGPYAASGFKSSEPTEKFNLELDIKFESKNKEKIEEILKKYNIPYENLNIEKEGFKTQKVKLQFKSYNRYEANSILNTFIKELIDNQIMFDPQSIKGDSEEEKIEKNPIGFKFGEK